MHKPSAKQSSPTSAVRPGFLIGVLVLALASVAIFLWHGRNSPRTRHATETETPASDSQAAAVEQTLATSTAPAPMVDPAPAANVAPLPPRAQPTPASASIPRAEPTAYTRQLVASLRLTEPLTPERAAEWKANLQRLIAQGAVAVPAIQEFLDQNLDLDFGPANSHSLGYASPRRALFDALQQIGGPESVGAMAEVLQKVADPKEIALLANMLAQQDPEQYRGAVLSAVHDTLAMAASKKLEGSDVGPLFEVLQKYGGPEAIADLEHATGQWKYYATIALAQFPDGAGIPSLVRMVEDPKGTGHGARDAALQMLAVTATQYPDARAALLEQARLDKIPATLWPYLVSPLAGDQFRVQDSVDGTGKMQQGSDFKTTHIAFGNQNFVSAPVANLNQDQLNQQMALVDELLGVASNPAALQALQESKAMLSKRTLQTAGVAPAQ